MLSVVALYLLLTISQIEAGDPLRCNGIDNGCCTAENPCVEGDGDCDSDSHCEGDLICGSNNCPWGDRDGCCKKVPSYKKKRCNGIDNGCCTAENPCVEGDGDCDSDSHCKGDLTCGSNNCPWGDGDDCCLDKARIQRDLIKKYKNTYLGLKNDGSDKYYKSVKKLLPALLNADAIDENEVGVAYTVSHEDTEHSLQKGENIILKKTKNEPVTLNGTVNGYVTAKRSYESLRERPTGFYAAPGDIVTITIPEHLVGKLKVHIGHQNYVSSKISFPLKRSVGKIASPWGGPIILEMTEKKAIKGEFMIKLDQATRAPAFVYGKDNNELWNKEIKKYAPKWASLRLPGQLDIWVQTMKIKNITDMEGTLNNIKETMDLLEAMLGLRPNSQPGAEQLIFDPNRGSGGYHVGHCRASLSVGSDMLYTDPIDKTDGDYHYYDDFFSINPLKGKGTNELILHEFGHGFCYGDLPGMGAQWTAKTVRSYIEYKRGMGPYGSPGSNYRKYMESPEMDFELMYRMVSFALYSNGKPCGEDKFNSKQLVEGVYDKCWKWLNWIPQKALGWDLLKDVFSLDSKSTKAYKSESDRMVDLYCEASKHNLLPLFKLYNLKPSETTITNCQKLPQSSLITKWLNIVHCVKESMESNGSKDIRGCATLPHFPAHEGLCVLSGVCHNDAAYGGKTTVMKNRFELYGEKSYYAESGLYKDPTTSRYTKKPCLERATIVSRECKNSNNGDKITATFYGKKPGQDSSYTSVEGGRCDGIDDGCCTAESPCVEGDGDCDSDSHCEGDLICGSNNCPWGDRDGCCKKGSK